MATNSKIEWTDHTWNPWEGCQKVGPGCDNCYAEARNARFAGGEAINWGPSAPRRRTSASNWQLPLKWNKQAQAEGIRYRVFCASLADVFDNDVPTDWRRNLYTLIQATPHLDWLLLTKRIGNARAMLNECAFGRWNESPLPNVWIGATIVNQKEADRDIPKLLAVPARVRFLSMEPLLGPVDLERPRPGPDLDQGNGHMICQPWLIQSGIDWIIVGGESGPNARPMHPDWARSLRDQCEAAGVPFLFKQWGEHSLDYDRDRDDPDYRRCDRVTAQPGRWINLAGGHGFNGERVHYAAKVGKKVAGRQLDGRTWDEVPS